ncbi:hypothetical protein COY28_00660 [Candidatus Woesearchaeota archaeon CG_4_10_14_0_2_um_filter_57_5]|nr:MAG: hypothetical protein AUJ68_03230 [Candidatus Woesearchaeota archaeon CG1_02_57_44]PIZ56838.1 MAG: hypothetical protein COY28_00660 [Candidatus Woesearchaeota archaeon CG_4_10_14_0_2_um_filter_57_5]
MGDQASRPGARTGQMRVDASSGDGLRARHLPTVYVFGNEYLAMDSFAHDIAALLRDSASFVHLASPDGLLDAPEGTLTILDVVAGINEPLLITDIAQLKARNIMTMHDFDVGYFLNLLAALGMAKDIRIIGIPQHGDAAAIAEKVRPWIKESD